VVSPTSTITSVGMSWEKTLQKKQRQEHGYYWYLVESIKHSMHGAWTWSGVSWVCLPLPGSLHGEREPIIRSPHELLWVGLV